jgi:HPt (histidine-containing phosphotransfer) domain-containing protein
MGRLVSASALKTMATNPLLPSMADTLARLWTKFLPEIEARVELVHQAAQALAAGDLPDAQRIEAHGAAHKLAGTLGTFGLHRGTDPAREAENILAEPRDLSFVPGLKACVAELQAVIQSKR